MKRVLTVVLGALTTLLAFGGPADADPAGPTHFRSTVTAIEAPGEPTGVQVDVLGGDAFLVVRAPPGVDVEVPGYEGEPYLRIADDGTVEINQRSPARWLNDARFGEAEVEVPPSADADAPPTWEVVADSGEYGWHDHRIHFMSPALPSSIDPARDEVQSVLDWSIPLLVEGREVAVRGELAWIPGPAPVLPSGAVLLVVVGMGAAVWWRPSTLPGLVGFAALLAGAVGFAAWWDRPAGVETAPALVVLPLVAVGVLAVAAGWRRRHAARAEWVLLAAGVPLVVWALVQFGALTRPIVPGAAPVALVRLTVAAGLGAGAASLAGAVRRVLDATSLDPAN